MNIPISPLIPGDSQFSSLQVNNNIEINNIFLQDNYIVGKGLQTTLNGPNVSYSANNVCGGIIIRTNGSGTDILPTPSEIALELNLNNTISSFIKYLTIVNTGNSQITLSDSLWTFTGTNIIPSNKILTWVLIISYNVDWEINAVTVGNVNYN